MQRIVVAYDGSEAARAAPAVGGRGCGGFHGLLVGSTARWVVDNAPGPVLVARGAVR